MTSPVVLTCHLCRRYPARSFTVRRHVGMVFVQQFVTLRQPMCRDHAWRAVRAYTLRTLWQGWWGYLSFFVNWFVLLMNLVVVLRAARLGAPRRMGGAADSEPVVSDPFSWAGTAAAALPGAMAPVVVAPSAPVVDPHALGSYFAEVPARQDS